MKKVIIGLLFLLLFLVNHQNVFGKGVKLSKNIVDFEIKKDTWYIIHQESGEKYSLNKYDNKFKLIKSVNIGSEPFFINICTDKIILRTNGYIIGFDAGLNKLWEVKGDYLIETKNGVLLLINEAGPVSNDCGEIRKIDPKKGFDIWKYTFNTGIDDYCISEDFKSVLINTEDKNSYFIKDGKLLQKKNNDYIVESTIDQDRNVYAIHIDVKSKPQLKKYNSNFKQIKSIFLPEEGISGFFKKDNSILFVGQNTIQLFSMKDLNRGR